MPNEKGLLTHEETKALFVKIQGGDESARHKIVQSNIRLVWKIARAYSNRGVEVEDLVQEGAIGLMTAAERFDHTRGIKFGTYATWWVRQAIGRYITNNGRSVRVPAHLIGFSYKARKATDEFKKEFGVEPTIEELSDIIGVTPENIKKAIESRNGNFNLDYDVASGESRMDRGGEEVTVASAVTSSHVTPYDRLADIELQQLVRKVLNKLSSREEKVMRLRFGIVEEPIDAKKFPITENEIEKLDQRLLSNEEE